MLETFGGYVSNILGTALEAFLDGVAAGLISVKNKCRQKEDVWSVSCK